MHTFSLQFFLSLSFSDPNSWEGAIPFGKAGSRLRTAYIRGSFSPLSLREPWFGPLLYPRELDPCAFHDVHVRPFPLFSFRRITDGSDL